MWDTEWCTLRGTVDYGLLLSLKTPHHASLIISVLPISKRINTGLLLLRRYHQPNKHHT